LRVVAVVGTTGPVSKTRALTELIISRLAQRAEIFAEVIEIHTLNPGLGSAIEREKLDERAEAAVRAAESADLLIAATPVFRGSYSGLFKHFFDFVDQYALAGKPVLLVATGGTDRHALVIDQALRPLFGFFQAWTAPMGIYLSSGDFDGTTVLNPEAYERIEVALDDIIPVARLLSAPNDEPADPTTSIRMAAGGRAGGAGSGSGGEADAAFRVSL
jgi:FMN reductase